jgi:hypothetical protein
MNRFRVTSLTAAIAVLATSGVAAAASAPVISKEKTLTGTKAPVAIGSLKKGAKLPAGDKIVFRTVSLAKGQKASVTMTAPTGKTLRALAMAGKIKFTVVSPKKFSGTKSVKLRVTATTKAKGTIYALVR